LLAAGQYLSHDKIAGATSASISYWKPEWKQHQQHQQEQQQQQQQQ